jgi:hypothetical protein
VDIHKANSYCLQEWPRSFLQTQIEKNLMNSHKNDLKVVQDKGKLLLDAIERSALKSTKERRARDGDRRCDENCVQNGQKYESDTGSCDMSESDISSIRAKSKYDVAIDNCDSIIPKLRHKKDAASIEHAIITRGIKSKLTLEDDVDKSRDKSEAKSEVEIPTALEQAKFRKDLDNAASMVFHSRTGLPLTSSPAPVRRGQDVLRLRLDHQFGLRNQKVQQGGGPISAKARSVAAPYSRPVFPRMRTAKATAASCRPAALKLTPPRKGSRRPSSTGEKGTRRTC